jgi:hypothetical protein
MAQLAVRLRRIETLLGADWCPHLPTRVSVVGVPITTPGHACICGLPPLHFGVIYGDGVPWD